MMQDALRYRMIDRISIVTFCELRFEVMNYICIEFQIISAESLIVRAATRSSSVTSGNNCTNKSVWNV